MKSRSTILTAFTLLLSAVLLMGCIRPSTDCTFTANEPLTVYRLPDSGSDIFGTMSTGDTFEALARTAEGWVGFDPGVAQAGNMGLARHRWILLNASLSESCLSSVDLVTLADVEADMPPSSP